ncbi:MAG TPA: hypothetical protein VIH54_12915, partial [Chthoniobacterales bacterium]
NPLGWPRSSGVLHPTIVRRPTASPFAHALQPPASQFRQPAKLPVGFREQLFLALGPGSKLTR